MEDTFLNLTNNYGKFLPNFPAAAAESVVLTFKVAMKKQMEGIRETRPSRFLFHYSTTLMPQPASPKQS